MNLTFRIPLGLLVFMRALLPFALALILFASALAFAQADAGTSAVEDVVHSVTDTAHDVRMAAKNPTNPVILVVLAVLMGIAQLIRKVSRKLPLIKGFNLGAWMNANWWADWVVSLTLSVGGAIATSLASGDPVDVGLIVNAIVIGMASAGMPELLKPKAPAPEAAAIAGAVAAADPSKQLNG